MLKLNRQILQPIYHGLALSLFAGPLLITCPVRAEISQVVDVEQTNATTTTHYQRTEHHFETPDLELVDQTGKAVRLRSLLESDQPVLLQFVFTTCATICPVLSASFANARAPLAAVGKPYRMVSISIDPEHDTPATLQQYAERFQAGEQWRFLTGQDQAIKQVLKAFEAYYPGNNKMYHQPYTYLHAHQGAPWIKIDGIMNRAEMVAEYRLMLESPQ